MRPVLSLWRVIVGCMKEFTIRLTNPEREELAARLRARTLPAEDVRRARLILMLDDGESFTTIQGALDCDRSYISRWKERFHQDRLTGLYSRHRGRAAGIAEMKLEAKILARTQRE